PVGEICGEIERALEGAGDDRAGVPPWDRYAGDYGAGVPLLQSDAAPLDREPVGRLVAKLVRDLAGSPVERLQTECSALDAQLSREPACQDRIAPWLLGEEDAFSPVNPGLLRFVGWSAWRRYLGPVLAAFALWRDEDQWLRKDCPACGAQPAMAQLQG